MHIEFKIIKKGGTLLQFVKSMKKFTGLGLKDAKDLCDKMNSNLEIYFEIEILDEFTLKDVMEELESLTDFDFGYQNLAEERQINFGKLGLLESDELLDIVSEKISRDILTAIYKGKETKNIIIKNKLEYYLLSLQKEQLIEILNKEKEN